MANTTDGTGWDTTYPQDSDAISAGAAEVRDLRKGVAIRANKEHAASAASSGGGEHSAGSAKCYHLEDAPTTRPNGDALTDSDLGRLWIDSNNDSANGGYPLFQYNGTSPGWKEIALHFAQLVMPTGMSRVMVKVGTTGAAAVTIAPDGYRIGLLVTVTHVVNVECLIIAIANTKTDGATVVINETPEVIITHGSAVMDDSWTFSGDSWYIAFCIPD